MTLSTIAVGRRPLPRRHALAIACTLVLSAAHPAFAQDEQTTTTTTTEAEAATGTPAKKPAPKKAGVDVELQSVEVIGIRHAIATATETKQEQNSIVEAVSSEDLGKLPDVSIAESLARLPGLTAQRVDGRAQVIAIRGMSPDFAATLLNGREQVSTGDNRGVEFDQYPSELLDSAVVYKTPDAELIGQGLSGTVDLHTVRPLSFGKSRTTFNLRGEYNGLGKQNFDGSKTGYRASASYIGQFLDHTLGVAVGVARLDSPFQEQHYKAWWWANTDPWGMPVAGKPADAIMLEGAEAWRRSRDQVRDGLMGVLQFKPNDSFNSTLDMYYSKFRQHESTRGAMWDQSPDWGGACPPRCISLSNATTTMFDGYPIVTGGTVNGVVPIIRNDNNSRQDELYSIGWNNEFKFNENWTGVADVYASGAKRHQDSLETYAGISGNTSIDFTLPLDSNDFPTFGSATDFSDPSTVLLRDPGNWGRQGRLEKTRQEDKLHGVRLAVNRVFLKGPFSSLDLGFASTSRDKEKTSSVYFAQFKNGGTSQAVDPNLLGSPTDLGFVGLGGVLSYDVNGVVNNYYDLQLNMSNDDLRKDFTVSEDVDTGYAKLDIDTDLGASVHLRGNVGVQYVKTRQSSTGFNVNSAAFLDPVTRGTSYNDVLPSLNLVFDFGGGWISRFGAAKTLARPRIDDMRASADASVAETGANVGRWSGNGGNPYLKPWRARSYDLSLEKYFGTGSYVALAAFFKNLDSYIYTQNVTDYDFTGFHNYSNQPALSNIGTFSTPENGTGGLMRGLEFSTSLDASLINPALTGFGVQFNASYTDTSIAPDPLSDPRNHTTLPGLSKKVANLVVYYEKNGFSARIAERYRSSFQGEITALFAQRSYTEILADRQTDLQLGYDFQPGSAMAGWGLQFQVSNLTNSPYRTVQRSDFGDSGDFHTTPLEYNLYGRQYLLGINYKF
jgi:iron complex outermembrane receptor protein